jgi:hypothetical protein
MLAAVRAQAEIGQFDGQMENADVAKKSFALFQKHLPDALKMGGAEMSKHIAESAEQLAKLGSEMRF